MNRTLTAESWNPRSNTAPGSMAANPAQVSASAERLWARRPPAPAASPMHAMAAERTAEGVQPQKTT